MSSKKKTSTKPATSRPSVIPIMKKKAAKGGKAKPQNKAKAVAEEPAFTPAASDASLPDAATGQEVKAAAMDAAPTDSDQATIAGETPPPEAEEATSDAGQATTLAEETPPTDASTPTSDTSEATTPAEETHTTDGDAIQETAPAAETPPADGAQEKKKGKAKKEPKPKKVSCLDAAAKVLADSATPMNCQEMIEAMAKANLWSSPNGQTPAATLYSAILREINTKGANARFTKIERGKFAAK